jgi:hypothetical protein
MQEVSPGSAAVVILTVSVTGGGQGIAAVFGAR